MLGRVWITDRGMASADNLAWLRKSSQDIKWLAHSNPQGFSQDAERPKHVADGKCQHLSGRVIRIVDGEFILSNAPVCIRDSNRLKAQAFLRLRATAWWSWSDSNQPPKCYGTWWVSDQLPWSDTDPDRRAFVVTCGWP